MPEYPISLGMSYGSSIGGAVPYPVKAPEPEVYYPNVHLEWEKDYELPEEGTITFRYRVTREVDDKKADKNCVDLDLLEIVSVKGDAKSKDDYEEASTGLDKIKAELEKE